MQQPLPTGATGSDEGAVAPSRKKKFVIAGVAALGASAIAVTPIAAGPNIAMSPNRDFVLTASTVSNPKVTDDPGTVYNGIFDITVNNVTGLGEAVMANPFPLLTQVAANQQGYLARVGDAFETMQKNADGFLNEGTLIDESKGRFDENGYVNTGNIARGSAGSGYPYYMNLQNAIKRGEIFRAYEEFNGMMLYAQTVTTSPIANLFLSRTDRTTGAYIAGIPEEMANNAAALVGALFSSTTMQSGIFYSAWAAFGGVPYEMARNVDEFVKAIQGGDATTVFNVLVNSPGLTVNALLNGFDYGANGQRQDPMGDGDTTAAWPGLLAPLATITNNAGNPVHPGGLVYQALTGMGLSLAKAIDNDPAAASSLFSGLNLSSITSGITATNAATDTVTPQTAKEEVSQVKEEVVEVKAVEVETDQQAKKDLGSRQRIVPGKAEVSVATVNENVVNEDVVTNKDAKDELTKTDAVEAKDTSTKPVSKSEQRRAKAQERAEKVKGQISSTVNKIGDSIKKATSGLSPKKSSASSSSAGSASGSSESGGNGSGGSSSGGSSGGSSND